MGDPPICRRNPLGKRADESPRPNSSRDSCAEAHRSPVSRARPTFSRAAELSPSRPPRARAAIRRRHSDGLARRPGARPRGLRRLLLRHPKSAARRPRPRPRRQVEHRRARAPKRRQALVRHRRAGPDRRLYLPRLRPQRRPHPPRPTLRQPRRLADSGILRTRRTPLTTSNAQRDPIPSQNRPPRGRCRRQRGSASRSAGITRGSPPCHSVTSPPARRGERDSTCSGDSCAPPVIPAPLPSLLRPSRHSCAGRNPCDLRASQGLRSSDGA